MTEQQQVSWLRRRNWWKIAFFVCLFAFEIAREIAVIANNEPVPFRAIAGVYSGKEWSTAEGQLQRIDGGAALSPVLVSIQCSRSKQSCTEVTVSEILGSISPPNFEVFPARFEADAIVFDNTRPLCARYRTRIDFRLQKTFSLRESTADKSEMCKGTEDRIEMQLGDSLLDGDLAGKHFLPLFALLRLLAT